MTTKVPRLFLNGPAPTKRWLIVLVTGPREYNDVWMVYHTLDFIHNEWRIASLVHGAAQGADTLAEQWAKLNGVPVDPFAAEWEKHGKKAGAIRNRLMFQATKPNLVVGFTHGGSCGPGTADMLKFANQRRALIALPDDGLMEVPSDG